MLECTKQIQGGRIDTEMENLRNELEDMNVQQVFTARVIPEGI